jgi:hypothetical protein
MDEQRPHDPFAEIAQQSVDVNVIRQAPDLQPGEEHPSVVEVQNFLKRFGYLDAAYVEGRTPERGRLDEVTVRALIEYQNFLCVGTGYGTLDAPTRESMAQPRCGMPDVQPGGMLPGVDARWVIACPGGWNRRFFTYAFGNMTSDVPAGAAQAAVERALQTWENLRWLPPFNLPFGLRFHRVEPSHNPDILVEWRAAADPDFNMVGNTIAHADFPSGCSSVTTGFPKPIHFDDSENAWAIGAVPGRLDVQTIATHEIGHFLGLGHEPDISDSIMTPSFGTNFVQRNLHQDDLDGYQVLYTATGNLGMIYPSHTGIGSFRVLDVFAYSQANGGKVLLWEWVPGPNQPTSWSGATNQRFRADSVGGGAYRFVAEHSGKVLDVADASLNNGAPIIQWDWHGGDNQRFRVQNAVGVAGNGPSGPRVKYHRITAVHSGKVLDVAGWSQALGAKVQQWDWNGTDNQLWGFGP